MTRAADSRAGFTLLEVMVAMAILATTLVVLLGLRNRDVLIQSHTQELTIATLLARDLVFEAENDKSLELGYLEGDFGEHAPDYSWERNVNTFLIKQVYQIQVKVMWGDGDRVELVRFVEHT